MCPALTTTAIRGMPVCAFPTHGGRMCGRISTQLGNGTCRVVRGCWGWNHMWNVDSDTPHIGSSFNRDSSQIRQGSPTSAAARTHESARGSNPQVRCYNPRIPPCENPQVRSL
jgi:hypothetical protein